MRTPRFLRAGIAMLALALAGCTLEPWNPSLPAEISAEPNYICSGDSVDVVWDLNLPLHESFCEYPAGGYSEPRSCASDSDCPVGGRCYDGLCCASPIPLNECGAACPPDATATVSFTPTGPTQTNPYGTGRITFAPTRTTAITLNGEWGPPTRTLDPVSTRVVVVDEPPREPLLMDFLFTCMGSGWAWSSFDLAAADVRPSPLVVITSVRNTSGRQINLSDGVHAPQVLDGTPTTAFNGPLAGTVWSASLTPFATIGLPLPRCTPLTQSDPYPDLSVEVELGCESAEP